MATLIDTVSPRIVIAPNLITLELMIQFSYADDPWLLLGVDEARHNARQWLVTQKLINDETLKPTEKGRAWVRFLMQVPLPVSFTDWRLPREEPRRE